MTLRRRLAVCLIAATQALTLPTLRRRRKGAAAGGTRTLARHGGFCPSPSLTGRVLRRLCDLTRMPEWCPLLSEVTFDEATRKSEWRMGFKGVSVGWTAENLEESHRHC